MPSDFDGARCASVSGGGPAVFSLAAGADLSAGGLVRAGEDWLRQQTGLDRQSAVFEVRALLSLCLGVESRDLIAASDKQASAEAVARFASMLTERANGKPVSRIAGTRGFWTLDLTLSPETLDPRADSETVIEAVLAHIPDRERSLAVCDLGTGSGCLLLAILSEYPHARGLGVDVSVDALETAAHNARMNGFSGRSLFARGDMTDLKSWKIRPEPDEPRPEVEMQPGWGGGFDLVLSNPPYIPTGHLARLDPVVQQWDPLAALDGGADGLQFYRGLSTILPEILAPGGIVALETGFDQAESVEALMQAAGLQWLERRQDYGGNDRCVLFQRQLSP